MNISNKPSFSQPTFLTIEEVISCTFLNESFWTLVGKGKVCSRRFIASVAKATTTNGLVAKATTTNGFK
jgi:hypothetical protein